MGQHRKAHHSLGQNEDASTSTIAIEGKSSAQDLGAHHRSSKHTSLKRGTEVADATETLNWDQVEIIDLLLRPWVRVDGTLNRRVLDRTLGAILGYIMQRPGLRISVICERFGPALPPQHCRELVELLEEIKCVQLQKFLNKRRQMSGLFSKT